MSTPYQDSKDLNKALGESLVRPSFFDIDSPNPGTRYVWPLLLILIPVVMAVMRISLMSNSAWISWIQYKIILLLLAIFGFGWLLAIKKNRKRKIMGMASLTFSLLLFSFFLTAESDRTRFFPIRGSTIILVAFLFAIGMLFLFAKEIHPITILGLLMIVFGLAHLLGFLANAAGVPFPDSFFVRMIILLLGGWILFFLGKNLPPVRFFWNTPVIFVVIFVLFLMVIGVIHY
jgi:hypothetical protein